MNQGLRHQLDEVFASRDRINMEPTIAAFLSILEAHPDEPEVLYEVGGAYDTAGQETTAAGYYRRAIDAGLDGKWLRQWHLQYGSTLRNLGRFDESLAVLEQGLSQFPDSESLILFKALTLHAMGRGDAAMGSMLTLVADRLRTDEILRYEAAIRGNGAYLTSRG